MCTNNLKQIALAMHNYAADNNTFPPAATFDTDGKPLLSWRMLILPYLDEDSLYRQFHLDEPWDSPHNKPLIAQIPPDVSMSQRDGDLPLRLDDV